MKIMSLFICSFFSAGIVFAQHENEMAKKLSNPFGYVSIPFQNNFDLHIEPNNGFRWTMNLMPVIPFGVTKDFDLINRIVVPIMIQDNIIKNTTQSGIGDILINSFLSPKGTKVVWGIGPSMYFPSGSQEMLTSKKWALGPGIIAATTEGRLTLGVLYFHMWSVAGDEKRPDFSFSYIQPVSIYNLINGWGVGVSAEISNEFKRKVSNGAIIVTGSKLVVIGGWLMNLVLGPKYYFGNFNKPEYGIRAVVNLLFP
jgi:hypothetical protein